MATTPNYGWVMPDPTDFVTSLPADFEIFGDAVDDTVKDLNPGTTAGDLDYYTSSTAKARLAIGTAGQVLAVNSGATAPEWATISSGGMTLLASGAFSGDTTLTSISGSYVNLHLVLEDVTTTSGDVDFRINGETGSSYFTSSLAGQTGGSLTTQWNGPMNYSSTSGDGSINLTLFNYANSAINKIGLRWDADIQTTSNTAGRFLNSNITAAITSITFFSASAATIAGNYKLYGVS